MKPRLDAFAANQYSQFGEDGCIAHILERIGEGGRLAVEFGAGDGLSCSNTAALWQVGWNAVLVEPDPARYEALEGNARLFHTILHRGLVTPNGPDSIGALLSARGIGAVDVMSIDVDGDDWFILDGLTVRPRLVVVEFNPTVPPHIEARQEAPGATFGASLLSIIRLGQSLGYTFVGATRCNAFLVAESEAGPFAGYETDPAALFPPGEYTYACSDFAGRTVLLGQAPAWGPREPYVLPLEASAYATPPTDSAQQLRRGFESLWGPAVWRNPDGLSAQSLWALLVRRTALVCIDLSSAAAGDEDWMVTIAEKAHYRALLVGRVLGLIRQ